MTILRRAPAVAVPIVRRSPRHDLECGYDELWEPDFGDCGDCGDRLQSGQEEREGLCYTCVRERAG